MKGKYSRIEMFGYPGSGKTTTLKKVQSSHPNFKTEKANINVNFKNGLQLGYYILSTPTILKELFLLRKVPSDKKKEYLGTIIRFFLRNMVLQKDLKNNKKVIVDEGMLQITWSLLLLPHIYDPTFDMNKKLEHIVTKYWPKKQLLIYHIHVSNKEYLRRIALRERKHPFSIEFAQNNKGYIEKGKAITEAILFQAQKKYQIISV